MIITITDGNKLTHSSGVPEEVRTTTAERLTQSIFTFIKLAQIIPKKILEKWKEYHLCLYIYVYVYVYLYIIYICIFLI